MPKICRFLLFLEKIFKIFFKSMHRLIKKIPGTIPKNLTQPEKYCRNLVYQHDRENFLTTNLLNHDLQRILFTLRALNIEIAMSTSRVSNAHMAEGRLLFWKSEIARKVGEEDNGENAMRTPVRTV